MRLLRHTCRTYLAVLVIGLVALTVQSDGRGLSPSSADGEPDTPDPTIVVVRPGSRLAWDQPQREVDVEVGQLGFWLLVDGEPQRLTEVVCGERNEDSVPCEAVLPTLEPGLRAIAVVASLADEFHEQRAESDTFTVVVGDKPEGGLGSPPPPPTDDPPPDGSGGDVTTVMRDLDDAVDLALLPDGHTALVAVRAGIVHLVDLPTARSQALAVPAPEMVRGDGRGLLSMAVAGDFERSGHVFVLYSTAAGVDLARFRLLDGALGERLIVASDVPTRAVKPAAVVRQNYDGRLLVAVDDAMAPARAGDLGDLAGKLLGLNADGTTPRAQTSVVLAWGLQAPRAVVTTANGMWVLDRSDALTTVLRRTPVGGAGATPTVILPGQVRAAVAVPSTGVATDDVVLVASEDGWLRLVRLGGGNDAVAIEGLRRTPFGDVVALAVRPDGVAYGLTSTTLLGFGGVR